MERLKYRYGFKFFKDMVIYGVSNNEKLNEESIRKIESIKRMNNFLKQKTILSDLLGDTNILEVTRVNKLYENFEILAKYLSSNAKKISKILGKDFLKNRMNGINLSDIIYFYKSSRNISDGDLEELANIQKPTKKIQKYNLIPLFNKLDTYLKKLQPNNHIDESNNEKKVLEPSHIYTKENLINKSKKIENTTNHIKPNIDDDSTHPSNKLEAFLKRPQSKDYINESNNEKIVLKPFHIYTKKNLINESKKIENTINHIRYSLVTNFIMPFATKFEKIVNLYLNKRQSLLKKVKEGFVGLIDVNDKQFLNYLTINLKGFYKFRPIDNLKKFSEIMECSSKKQETVIYETPSSDSLREITEPKLLLENGKKQKSSFKLSENKKNKKPLKKKLITQLRKINKLTKKN